MSGLGHCPFEAQCRRRLPEDAGVRGLTDARQHGRHSVPVPLPVPLPVLAVVVVFLATDFCDAVPRFISSRHGDVTYSSGLLLALFRDRGFDTDDDNGAIDMHFIVLHLKTVLVASLAAV